MTEDWVLHDAFPIRLPTGYQDQLLSMVVEAAINGLTYRVYDASGSTIEGGSLLYGKVSGQFNNLGSLYTTYRMDKLEL